VCTCVCFNPCASTPEAGDYTAGTRKKRNKKAVTGVSYLPTPNPTRPARPGRHPVTISKTQSSLKPGPRRRGLLVLLREAIRGRRRPCSPPSSCAASGQRTSARYVSCLGWARLLVGRHRNLVHAPAVTGQHTSGARDARHFTP
jgi:hypothetical protein